MQLDANPIGEDIAVVPREHIDTFNNLDKYRCDNVSRFPDNWTTTVTIPQDQSATSGERLDAWIFDIDGRNQEITATTSGVWKSRYAFFERPTYERS